jgi:DNA-binding transcriptional MerR regulator
MRIGDLAEACGLSVHTIRYYERIGLLPYAPRGPGGRRDYDQGILVWIRFIGHLRATGMPIREMLRYAKLRAEGPGTEGERCRILAVHRDRVRADLAELNACLRVLDQKIAAYGAPSEEDDDHADQPQVRRPLPARPEGPGRDRRPGR